MRLRGLYAITPDWPDSRALMTAVESAMRGGAAMLQLRRKGLPSAQVRSEAHALAGLCREFGIPFIVNDDARLALECGADGVHMGQADGGVAAARAVLGNGRLVGISCYDEVGRVRSAESAGADYVAVGSLFPSTTKPWACAAPLSVLSAAKQGSRIPVVGIGGIDLSNARLARDAGADMVAVIGALFGTPSAVEDTARQFSSMWE